MTTCPKCKKQELKAGEELCPHCLNKKTNLWVKVGEGVIVVVGVVLAVIFGGKRGKTS
jgi:NMD protein affecting ribosome stability and mRNA decay